MRIILIGIAVICISYGLAFQVCAQPATAFAQPLTPTEQARLLGLVTSKDESPSLLLNNSADYHIAQAKKFLQVMDDTKPSPPIRTSGYRLIKPIVFHIEEARLAGVSYESSINEIYRNSPRAPALIKLWKESILNNMKASRQFGLLTPENMQRLEQGLQPVVTKGKFLGDPVEVHHRALYSLIPEYENDVANLQLLPQSMHDEKWVHEVEFSKEHEARLNRAHWADRNTMAGGAISSGFGLLLLNTSGSALLVDLNAPHNDLISKLRIGENTSLFVSGGAMSAVGISEIGSRLVISDRALSVFGGVTKWGGSATLAGIIIAEPIALNLDYENWDKMTTSQRIGSVVQHGVNIGSGTYQAYRIYRASRAAQTLIGGTELFGEQIVAGGGPEDPVTDTAAVVTLAGTFLLAGGQYAYDYFHPIQPSWNSSAL
jgi:hypothetical protein